MDPTKSKINKITTKSYQWERRMSRIEGVSAIFNYLFIAQSINRKVPPTTTGGGVDKYRDDNTVEHDSDNTFT